LAAKQRSAASMISSRRAVRYASVTFGISPHLSQTE
jgi:hypothetical protein